MIIREASVSDISIIHQLAHNIWWPTYNAILQPDQISFMLKNMYSEATLLDQMNEGVRFLVTENDQAPTGFAGYSLIDQYNMVFKIHKLYILPTEQGKGTGRKLVERIITLSQNEGGKILELNVNRSNPAVHFYKNLGFEIYQEIDISYYQYELNDYVMRKSLAT
jgi:diamine N-acetyltransferase